MFFGDFCVAGVRQMFHNATHLRSRLKLWNESGTNRARIGDSYPLRLRSPQYLALAPHNGTRSSLAPIDKRRYRAEILNCIRRAVASGVNKIPQVHATAVAWISRSIPVKSPSCKLAAGDYCVLATRGGVAEVMNWVASSIAEPSGVGITIRKGTKMRVPASGAKATSMLRWAVRYLITARSGI
jgi:hypothetical protein